MSFAAPAFLWGLLLVPAAVAAYALAQRRRARYAVRFTNLDLLANLVPKTPGWRRHAPAALYLLSLAALLMALARPRAIVPVPRDTATVVMVMDVSGSMMASDVQPTRLGAARAAAQSFLDRLPARFRVALVSFASNTRLVVPPTTDRGAVGRALDGLRAEGGTAMGDGIERALDVVQTAQTPGLGDAPAGRPSAPGTLPGSVPLRPGGLATPGAAPAPTPAAGAGRATPGAPGAPGADRIPAAVLLLSDGANSAGWTQPLEAAARAEQLGIPVYTIALGTPGGVLETQDRFGRRQRTAVPPDDATLQRIAETTGGQFFTAPTAEDLRSVYQQIGSRIGFDQVEQEITFAFAAAGAAFLVAGGALGLAWFNRFP
jgi:Ca-activated chloride channel family protein